MIEYKVERPAWHYRKIKKPNRPKLHLMLFTQNTIAWSWAHGNILHYFYMNKIRFWLISLMFPLGHCTSSASKRVQSSASVALHRFGFYASSFSTFKCVMKLISSLPHAGAPRRGSSIAPGSRSCCWPGPACWWHTSDQFVRRKYVFLCGVSGCPQQPQPKAWFLPEAPPVGALSSIAKGLFSSENALRQPGV